jgi:fatty-acid desaturase
LQLKKDNVSGFVVCHCVAALAIFPWFFSWSGVVLLAAGLFVFGVLGINIAYHRLITHRSLSCPLWFEHVLAVCGVASLQFAPAFWTAVHRRHHHFADQERDPHSPIVSFFWAHFGWLLVRPEDMKRGTVIDRYAKDVLRDPFYGWLENRKNWMKVGFAVWIALFAAGFCAAMVSRKSAPQALQFGLSLLVWGGALRTILYWHFTWSVNSVTHLWGYRNYETPDHSRNNPIIALLAGGEGWHNNHHADPGSARHGHQWWEIDLAWLVLRLLMLVGLVSNAALPSPDLAAVFNARASAPEEDEPLELQPAATADLLR